MFSRPSVSQDLPIPSVRCVWVGHSAVLAHSTDRLEFASLEKFYRVSRPLHLLRVVAEQEAAAIEGRG